MDWIFDCTQPDYYSEIRKLYKCHINTDYITTVLHNKLPALPLGQNRECIYEVIFLFDDDEITDIFKKRMVENSKPIVINSDYFNTMTNEGAVPKDVISKLKILKGMTFKDNKFYGDKLEQILDKDEFISYKFNIFACGRLDPDDYSRDIYNLLITRHEMFHDEESFISQIKIFKHAVSYQYFLKLHLNELKVESQLNILRYLLNSDFKDHAMFGYYAATCLDNIYKIHKDAYLSFIEKNKEELPELFWCVIDNTCP